MNVTGHWYLSDDNCNGGGLQLKRQQTYILLLDVDKNAINQSHLKAASSTTDSSAPVDAAAAPIEFTVETEAQILKHLGELYLYRRLSQIGTLAQVEKEKMPFDISNSNFQIRALFLERES